MVHEEGHEIQIHDPDVGGFFDVPGGGIITTPTPKLGLGIAVALALLLIAGISD